MIISASRRTDIPSFLTGSSIDWKKGLFFYSHIYILMNIIYNIFKKIISKKY